MSTTAPSMLLPRGAAQVSLICISDVLVYTYLDIGYLDMDGWMDGYNTYIIYTCMRVLYTLATLELPAK